MESAPFIPLLLITALAAFVPILASRLRRFQIPIVVGEIFAGILIGKSGLNLIEPSQTLTFLAEFGFAYLMFLSGLEVDFRLLRAAPSGKGRPSRWLQPLPLTALMFAATLGLAFGASAILTALGLVSSPLLPALILSTTSLGVVVPVLKERRLLGSAYGQYLLVAASVADFASLLLLTLAIALRSKGLTFDLLLIPLLLLIFALAARLGTRAAGLSALQRFIDDLSTATSQLRVRGAFALMVSWVVLAEALGVEVILGAFLAGAIAGLVSGNGDEVSREKLDAIGYGFFIPIFFIMVGVEFDLRALFANPQALLLIPLLTAIAYLVKIIPGALLRLRLGWRETIAGGFLLSSRLSLIIAASSIALGIGAISQSFNAAIILLAIISCTGSPVIFNRMLPERERKRRRGIIIIGQDQLAEYLASRLKAGDESITAICPDDSRLQAFEELGVRIIRIDGSVEEKLREADADRARVLLDLTNTTDETLEVCDAGRRIFGIPLVISRISDVELIPRLQAMGVKVVQPALATAMALEGATRYPTAFEVLTHSAQNVEVSEVRVSNPRLIGVPLKKIRLPGDALILSLGRGETVMVPHGETILERDDRVGLIGSLAAVREAQAFLRR